MAIDLQAISITSAINTIKNFFSSQENNSKWKDYTTSSEGSFLIRMLANILSNISYRLVSARREILISTANLLSSVLGISVNLGYSAYRGTNQRRTVTITPYNNYTIERLNVLGTYNEEYDIINLENITLVKDSNVDIKVVIGKVKTISFTAGTTTVKEFQLLTQLISEDYMLYVDGIEVPTTKIKKELADDKYLVATNPYSSVNILYLNNNQEAQYKYGTETVITLKYVELADVPTIDFTTDMLSYGDLVNTKSITNYVAFESVSSIKINAPIYHETQNLIRSKADYSKETKLLVSNIIDTSFNVLTPTYTLITYLKDDLTMLTNEEIENINPLLESQNFFGTPLPDITKPRKELVDLDIYINLSNKYVDLSNVNEDLSNLLKLYYSSVLEQTINTYDIENYINKLSYVKYSRVNLTTSVWNDLGSNQIYLGKILENNGIHYKAKEVLAKSGSLEPSWVVPLNNFKGIDTNLETVDNNIIWKAYKRLSNTPNLTEWKPNKSYKILDYVYSNSYPNFMFKCVDIQKSSGAVPIDVSSIGLGEYTLDGQIIWVKKVYNSSYPTRANNTVYRLGDSVKIDSYTCECIGYTGVAGTTKPILELPNYNVVAHTTNTVSISSNYLNFFDTNDVIQIYYSETVETYSIVNASYNAGSNQTTLELNQNLLSGQVPLRVETSSKGTYDGEIYWEIVPNISNVSYNWNVYNNLNYNLTAN